MSDAQGPSPNECLKLLPGAYTTGGQIGEFQGILTVEEEALIEGSIPKRRREFIAGRTAAKLALAAAGCPMPSISRLSGERAPVWPEGYTGSITHSDTLCYAIAATLDQYAAVGIDVERCGRISQRMWRLIYNQQEQQWIRNAENPELLSTLIFSCKEAVYKAVHTLHGIGLPFTSIDIVPDGNAEFSARVALAGEQTDEGLLRGRYIEKDSHVITAVGIPPATKTD